MKLLTKNLEGFQKLNKAAICFSIAFCITLVSCKSPAVLSSSGESEFARYLFKKVNSNDKENISCDQIDISISDGDTKSFKTNLYISRGNFIYANVNFLGFELARIELNPDSIKIINRLEKTYFFDSFSSLYEIAGLSVTYSQLESLILKGLICDESKNFRKFKNCIYQDSITYKFSSSDLEKYTVNSYFSKSTFIEERIEILDFSESIILEVKLDMYSDNKEYPKLINAKLKRENSNIVISIKLNKIGKDKPTNRSFLINNRYREMDF